MKKTIIATMLCLFGLQATQAQVYRNSKYYNPRTDRLDYSRRSGTHHYSAVPDIYYGLRVGPTFSNVSSDSPDLDGGGTQTGLNVGAVIGFGLSRHLPLYLETGLSYTEKGGKKETANGKMTYDLNYLELPVVLKYVCPVTRTVSIQPYLGGYVACGVGGKIKNYGSREAYSSFGSSHDQFKSFDGGLKVGAGVQVDMFYADLNYDLGLANIGHDSFDSTHNGALTLNVGVNF